MDPKADFDLDDPLGDLLSDNSNDSFFKDDDFPSSKPKKSRESSLDKKKMNLFGLENETTGSNQPESKSKQANSTDDWLGLVEKTSNTLGLSKIEETKGFSDKKPMAKKMVDQNITKPLRGSYPDSLNFLDDLGLSDNENETKKEGNKTVTKSSILDELLGKSPKKSNMAPQVKVKKENTITGTYNPSSSFGKVIKKPEDNKILNSKLEQKNNIEVGNKPDVKKNEQEKEVANISKKESFSNPSYKRQRSNTDWLGLYTENENEDDLDILGDKNKGQTNLDWLNPSAIKEKNIQSKEVQGEGSKVKPKVEEQKVVAENQDGGLSKVKAGNFEDLLLNPEKANLSLLGDCDVTEQSAAIFLQQQESQLMVALQLKAQEERLAGLTERHEESRKVHQEVMSSHRQQVDRMLQGHAQQRAQLQRIIAQHQHRITQHIQTLLRPSTLSKDPPDDDADGCHFEKNADLKKEKVTEQMQLEQIIGNLKENHNREMDLMETSYRRQVQILEDSLAQIEERFKSENEKMTGYYSNRIELLEKENADIRNLMDEKIKSILDKQNAERDAVERKHQNDLLILQEQSEHVIKSIRDTFALEKETIRESCGYSQGLQEALQGVTQNNAMCSGLVQRLEDQASGERKERESRLKHKEEQIAQMLDGLQKQRVSFELESQSMKSALQTLEDSLKQQITVMGEERLSLRQKEKAVEMEREIFQQECETARKILSNEKENLKMSTQNIHEKEVEMEKRMAEKLEKINLDKLTIENDKKTTENLKTQSQNLKLNLDAETEELKDAKNKLQYEEKRLQQENAALAARSQELETLTRSALAKQVNADRKASEAEYARQRYEERLKRMQEQAIALNAREQQIARDKVALSRERLALHDQMRQAQLGQCGLCKTTDNLNTHGARQRNIDLLEMLVTKDEMKNDFDANVLRSVGVGNVESKNENAARKDTCEEFDFTSAFQEIVDPKLLQLKLDVKSATQHLNC